MISQWSAEDSSFVAFVSSPNNSMDFFFFFYIFLLLLFFLKLYTFMAVESWQTKQTINIHHIKWNSL